jgi:hypothetical protein
LDLVTEVGLSGLAMAEKTAREDSLASLSRAPVAVIWAVARAAMMDAMAARRAAACYLRVAG